VASKRGRAGNRKPDHACTDDQDLHDCSPPRYRHAATIGSMANEVNKPSEGEQSGPPTTISA
jgi:hypothetical protein